MIALVSSGLLLALPGCGSRTTPESKKREVDYARVRGLSDLYYRYKVAHNSQPPKDEPDFRAFLASQQAALERHGLTIDDMFVSPRNGQPFTWVYGKSIPSPQIGEYYGYEKSTSDGKLLIIGARGMFEVKDEAQVRALLPN